ncbi:MAG: response regulator [Flavobacterium sp.]|nr:response regulator [Flavobacterium sp.]
MKPILFLFIIVFPLFVFSHTKRAEIQDSIGYYTDQAKYSKVENNYKNCLVFSQKALDYAKKNNNQKAIASCYSNLGTTYIEIEKYDDAIEVLIKSISVFTTLPASAEQAFTHYSLGICYLQKDNFTMAERNFDVAKSIYEKLKISSAIEMLDFQKAIIYRSKGMVNLALPVFENIVRDENVMSSNKLKSEALYQIGLIEIDKKHPNLAINYLNKSLDQGNTEISRDLKSKIIYALSSAYEINKDLKMSYSLLKKYLKLKDSIIAEKNSKIGIEDFDKFKESEKLKLVEQIETINKSQQKANSFAKILSIFAIAFISILSLLSLSLYKNNVIRNQSNLLLRDKNNELYQAKENAENASKARSEFLSTVSHELRTPLNAINGITHLLIEENPKESQIHYLNSLKFSGNYLLTFINDILEINRIESNNIPIEQINFNLKSLLANIQNSLKEIAQENNNTFFLEIDDQVPENLIGDPTKLSQIFMNLINNSLKFTRDGYVKVIAKIDSNENNALVIAFKVSDNGIGIPDDKQAEIFNSFSQGSIEINRKYGGTGLGLSIVKRLIELLGGNIYLNSKVGLGSTFSFMLFFEVGENEVLVTKEKKFDLVAIKNKKILLVEDNKINQMTTKKMLENRGMICKIVDNGEESIELLKVKNDFDLVLMDVHLPGINGTIATQKIREFDELTPIIALTAISLNENREMLLSYGMTDVITKPFEPEKFYQIIAENL